MKENSNHELKTFIFVALAILSLWFYSVFIELSFQYKILVSMALLGFSFVVALLAFNHFSKWGKDQKKRLKQIQELPETLYIKSCDSVLMGYDLDLQTPIYLPDSIRSRHVHVIGASGSGKTESVIQNFLKQDADRGIGSIILDAKGDLSFLKYLEQWPNERVLIFDLGDEKSQAYNPLADGTPLEAAQRLFSSLTWSEEYYASKARSVLQIIFQVHFKLKQRNPTLKELANYLSTPKEYTSIAVSPAYPEKLALNDYMEITGLRDQINSLCTGHLESILSPELKQGINLQDSKRGKIIYFRLQSLMSPQIVATLGKLLINHLNFLAGTAHRGSEVLNQATSGANLVPIYLDEFASFACPEFADLNSKARSAGFALHFSHQSIGDVNEVSKGFLNRITDNSATKIVMRINDPDSAEFFSRSFGTKITQKVTKRISNVEDVEAAEVLGEGSLRDTREFRASPDLFKTLPTGVGSVLVAHGMDTAQGASSVFRVRFPALRAGR